MSDLLIRNIDAHLKEQLEESARAHHRSLSEEARLLLKQALVQSEDQDQRKMGTFLFNLVQPEFRGDDLVFEIEGDVGEPPDFK